jgi:hypothetical protein
MVVDRCKNIDSGRIVKGVKAATGGKCITKVRKAIGTHY